MKGSLILVAMLMASIGVLFDSTSAIKATPAATVEASRPTLSESWRDFKRGHIEILFTADVDGLIERTSAARNQLIDTLNQVLAPYHGCQIEYGEVAIGVDHDRTTSYDLASLIEGLIVTEFPEFQAERRLSPVGTSLRSTYFLPYGQVSLKLLFDDHCEAAGNPATPQSVASSRQATPTP